MRRVAVIVLTDWTSKGVIYNCIVWNTRGLDISFTAATVLTKAYELVDVPLFLGAVILMRANAADRKAAFAKKATVL